MKSFKILYDRSNAHRSSTLLADLNWSGDSEVISLESLQPSAFARRALRNLETNKRIHF